MLTRVVEDHICNLGRTFRLLIDGFAHQMSSEVSYIINFGLRRLIRQEIVLHALHENGQVETQDLEAHIKDDIEREGGKIAEMTRKVKQAFREVVSRSGFSVSSTKFRLRLWWKMICSLTSLEACWQSKFKCRLVDVWLIGSGNFAEELGEDFLGLRELGIDKEFGLSSLSVPSSLFHGRRRRAANAANGWVLAIRSEARADPTGQKKMYRIIHPHHLSSLSIKIPFKLICPLYSTHSLRHVWKQVQDWPTTRVSILPMLRSLPWVKSFQRMVPVERPWLKRRRMKARGWSINLSNLRR